MDVLSKYLSVEPRPGLHPIPGTTPLTLEAMICPPLIYYLALLFLPPAPPPTIDTLAVKTLRNVLAFLAAFLFFRLPLTYHVPQSIGLTYQLGLVGLYGGARVLDAFFISPYMFGHVPRRVIYKHESRVGTPLFEGLRDLKTQHSATSSSSSSSISDQVKNTKNQHDNSSPEANKATNDTNKSSTSASDLLDNIPIPSLSQSYFLLHRNLITGPQPKPVLEHTIPEDGWPHTFSDRASWALELELSMRGVGFTWSTADVRHTRKTWLPTVHNRLHSILVHDVPTLAVCFAVVRSIYLRYGLGDVSEVLWHADVSTKTTSLGTEHLFDTRLPFGVQIALTGCLGAFLMAAFAFAHSTGAVLLSPLAPHPLAFFPPLYTVRIWQVRCVREFWSYGWHRLFARFFLVYGIWPGEWIERKITGKGDGERADVGKVLGGFLCGERSVGRRLVAGKGGGGIFLCQWTCGGDGGGSEEGSGQVEERKG
ncbi:hypothetical protein N0V93_008414 [Gnomoniopsis smithogilvyi]|uniref:Wax synthase domain-containing protein n=1 Tax=Gnomoniopsis smithogilvyi TaxID=1191159 RepID=A0A9W9CTV6_9PEZI|nr:hypothetical protein N0V93_008414 [Gnomoniopsis smithogilvyi]